MFIILIGSFARDGNNLNSDVDICRIETTKRIKRKIEWKDAPISYIDFSLEDFTKIYNSGSLFIYHVVKQGVLLEGNEKKWNKYVQEFKFIDCYLEEVIKLKEILLRVLDVEIYGKTYLSFYSNLFRILKNFSIFWLAHNGEFEFDKKKAYEKVFGNTYYNLLNSAYNKVERNIINNNDESVYYNEIIARKMIESILFKIKELKL